jgi:hypothetical protein
MKITAFFSLLFLPALLLQAQGLDIYLDATKGKTVYVSGKDTLSRPVVKRGQDITLHLVNFNNYLYEVEVDELQRQITYFSTGIDTSSVGGLAKSPGGGGGSAFDLISTIMNPSGLLGLGQLAGGQLSMLGGLSFAGIKGFAVDDAERLAMDQLQDVRNKYEKVLEEWTQTENNLMSIQSDVELLVNAWAVQSMAHEEIRKLQFNPNLSPTQIKTLAEEYLRLVFSNMKPSEIDMGYLWKIYQKSHDLSIYVKDLETEKNNYTSKLAEIQSLGLQLDPLQQQVYSPKALEAYRKMNQSIQASIEKGEKEVKRLDATYEDLQNLVSRFGEDDFQQLVQLRYMYEEIGANDFSYTYHTTAKDDVTSLTVKLNPKESLPDAIQVKSRRLAAIEVHSKGGLKINGSLGIGFGQFFSPPQSYYVRDSIILSDQEGSFSPYLASFLHFYNYRPGQTAFGGSFGIGLPVFGSSNKEQSVAFFLGPSVYLGTAQRITLTGGIMGARAPALGNGYKVGDVLDNPFAGIPTVSRYQLGYFIGVSINVIGN